MKIQEMGGVGETERTMRSGVWRTECMGSTVWGGEDTSFSKSGKSHRWIQK